MRAFVTARSTGAKEEKVSEEEKEELRHSRLGAKVMAREGTVATTIVDPSRVAEECKKNEEDTKESEETTGMRRRLGFTTAES